MDIGFLVLLLVIFAAVVIIAIKKVNEYSDEWEKAFAVIYAISLGLFMIGMEPHSHPYYKAIEDVGDACYSPFGVSSVHTLTFYFLAFNISVFLIWTKGTALPPLTLVLSLVFTMIGIIISCVIVLQLSNHDTSSLRSSGGGEALLIPAPVSSIIIAVLLIFRTTRQRISDAAHRMYSNTFLNALNRFLATKSKDPVWILLLLLPVFVTCTLILFLFGQDVNAIVKVFTDTTTWRFSQQSHPPLLTHQGHYLCTVAAKGDPRIVKPICIGKRHGREIIVNRQLQIANAFEELMQDLSPKVHGIIRRNYDRYGYNLSLKINSVWSSNFTYILMKPLEWIFLIGLYLLCLNPELKISRQYTT